MPARIAQRVDQVPRDWWRPFCLECIWTGPEVDDEPTSGRLAYEHNREHHDGAGIEPGIGDLVSEQGQLRLCRRMYRQCAAMALFSAIVTVMLVAWGNGGFLLGLAVGVNTLVAAVNGSLAGKWALRHDATQFRLMVMHGDAAED